MSGGNAGYGGNPAASNLGSCNSESDVNPASSAVAGPVIQSKKYII